MEENNKKYDENMKLVNRLLDIEKENEKLRKAYEDMKDEKNLMALFGVGWMLITFVIIICRFI